jgi:hypothetical protein
MPRTAQADMRHSKIDLTMSVYTDPKLLDVRGALDVLPVLSRDACQEDAEVIRATGTEAAPPVLPVQTDAGEFALKFAQTLCKPVQTGTTADKRTGDNDPAGRKDGPAVTTNPVKRKDPLTSAVRRCHRVGATGLEPVTPSVSSSFNTISPPSASVHARRFCLEIQVFRFYYRPLISTRVRPVGYSLATVAGSPRLTRVRPSSNRLDRSRRRAPSRPATSDARAVSRAATRPADRLPPRARGTPVVLPLPPGPAAPTLGACLDPRAIAAQPVLRAIKHRRSSLACQSPLHAACGAKIGSTHRRIRLAPFLADGILPAFPITRRDAG